MAYEFQIFKCPRGCALTFWTINDLYAHHFDQHEQPLPQMVHRPLVPPPPSGGVAATALELVRAGLITPMRNGTRGHEG